MRNQQVEDLQQKHEIQLQYKRLERDSEERKLETLKTRLKQKIVELQQPQLYRAG